VLEFAGEQRDREYEDEVEEELEPGRVWILAGQARRS